jgi:hypothetical protein
MIDTHLDSRAPRAFSFSRASAASVHFASFAASLVEAGYVPSAAQLRLRGAVHLGYWADREGIHTHSDRGR